MKPRNVFLFLSILMISVAIACGGKADRPPVTSGAQRDAMPRPTSTTPPPPRPVAQPSTPADDIMSLRPEDEIEGRTLDDLNADSPLDDIHFDFDSAVLRDEARAILERNSDWLKRYPTVRVLIEGHCDERGTVEYNLALGEKRAAAAYNYLVQLGIPSDRLQTISYGKEQPLDPGHNEAAWAANRRGHFRFIDK